MAKDQRVHGYDEYAIIPFMHVLSKDQGLRGRSWEASPRLTTSTAHTLAPADGTASPLHNH